MFKALSRTNAETVSFQMYLEPLELRYASANAKDKDKVLDGPLILVWEKNPRIAKSKPSMCHISPSTIDDHVRNAF